MMLLTGVPGDHYVTNTEQVKAPSGWMTYSAMEQKITSLTVDISAGRNTTVDTMRMCQYHVASVCIFGFFSVTATLAVAVSGY